MTQPEQSGPDAIPEAVEAPRSRWRLPLVWLIPAIAALAGGWLAVKSVLDKGPTVSIEFHTAEGIEAGKTRVRYRDIDIGVVTQVVLREDAQAVVVTAELAKAAAQLLVEDSRFWVVRPAHHRRWRVRAGHAALRRLHRTRCRPFGGAATEVRRPRGAADPDRRAGRPRVHAEGRGSRLARLWHADLLPAPAGRQRDVVRARQGRRRLTIRIFVNAPYDGFVKTGLALLARERDRRFPERRRHQRRHRIGRLAHGGRHSPSERRRSRRRRGPRRRRASSSCTRIAPMPSASPTTRASVSRWSSRSPCGD